MLSTLRNTLISATLLLALMATECAAQTMPRQTMPRIGGRETPIDLAFAPNGKSLWSEDSTGQLTIRSGDGQTERYRGALPDSVSGGMRILSDGSFLRATQAGALQWFEPPQEGQPLRVRRELEAPPAMDWEIEDPKPARSGSAPHGARSFLAQFSGGRTGRKLGALRDARALAVAPGEQRVAISFTIRRPGDSPNTLDSMRRKQEIIRVWNLESGVVEMEQSVTLPGWGEKRADPYGLPDLAACLGWADARTLVVARGLTLARFNVLTGRQISAWRPADAWQTFGVASVMNDPKYATLRPVEQAAFRASAPPVEFDVGGQRLAALSNDGTQLVLYSLRDGGLTVWNSATNEAQILGWQLYIDPEVVRFSGDGTKVAVWDGRNVWSWRSEARSDLFRPSTLQTVTAKIKGGRVQNLAVSDDFLALAGEALEGEDDEPFVLRFVPSAEFGRR